MALGGSLRALQAGRQAVREHPWVGDAAGAGLVYAVMLGAPVLAPQPGSVVLEVLSARYAAAGALVCAALALRRRWPLGALAVTAAGTFLARTVLERSGAAGGPFLLASSIAVFFFVLASRRVTGLAGGVVTGAVLFCGGGLWGPGSWWVPDNMGLLAWTGMAVAAADGVRSRRAYVAAVQERALRAEEAHEQEARRRVAEERLRLARELHDVVAHHVAVIQVHAGVAAHMLRADPTAAEQALGHVRGAASEVLAELGPVLTVLRGPGDGPVEPAPGLSRLGALIRSFSAAGLRVDSASTGPALSLPAAVDLAAYRLIQESLTNAHKHGGDCVQLRLAFCPGQLTVEVCNGPPVDGARPVLAAGTGRGLLGMRERVHAVGGQLNAGPASGGGFRVRALLPLPEPEPEPEPGPGPGQ